MKFQVFANGQPVQKFRLCGASMFGTDGASLRRTKITFSDGIIECEKPNSDTAGLALLWPVEGFGRVLLSTTCLPERDAPYCLNVEVLRARLMQTIDRRQEWSLFEGAAELEDVSKQAQDLFVKAIQNIREPAKASLLADNAMRRAMIFSEKLAVCQAESLFKTRREAEGFGRTCLGVSVSNKMVSNDTYVDRLSQLAPFAYVPICWADIEKSDGIYDFSELDKCIEILSERQLLLGAGPLLSFSKEALPPWLLSGRASFEKVRELAYRFVTEAVSRYRGQITRWFVISGLNAANHFGFTVEQVLEMTRAATLAAKATHAKAFRLVEVTDPWGEYCATTSNCIGPVAYMDMVLQSGIAFEAFALRLAFGKNERGMHIRDMMQISSRLDYFSLMGKALYVTGVEIPSAHGEGDFDGRHAGVWHKAWDAKRQALWLDQFYTLSLSKPSVESVVYGNLVDHDQSVIANSGLVQQDYEPKEGYRVLRRLRELVQSKV